MAISLTVQFQPEVRMASIPIQAGDFTAESTFTTGLEQLRELATQLRGNRTSLHAEWTRRMVRAGLLQFLDEEQLGTEAEWVLAQYLDALELGTPDALEAYGNRLAEHLMQRGAEQSEVIAAVLLLREVLVRWLLRKHHSQPHNPSPTDGEGSERATLAPSDAWRGSASSSNRRDS